MSERRPGHFNIQERVQVTFENPLTEVSDELRAYEGQRGHLVSDWDWHEINRPPLYRRYDVEIDGKKVQFLGWMLRLEEDQPPQSDKLNPGDIIKNQDTDEMYIFLGYTTDGKMNVAVAGEISQVYDGRWVRADTSMLISKIPGFDKPMRFD